MPLIQLQTGKTIYVSVYEYYFLLKEEDVDDFFQQCIADDLGEFVDDPFSNKKAKVGLKEQGEEEEIPDIVETPNLDIDI